MKSKLLILLLFFVVGCAQTQGPPIYTHHRNYEDGSRVTVMMTKVIGKGYTRSYTHSQDEDFYTYAIYLKTTWGNHYVTRFNNCLYNQVEIGDYIRIKISSWNSSDFIFSYLPIHPTVE